MILELVCGLLAITSLLDGISTTRFLKLGYQELNPIFGPRPSTTRVFGEGMSIIAAEIGIALLVTHYHPMAARVFIIGGLVQSAIHIYEAIKNWRLK